MSWFALDKLGAVATLINTAMRGPALVARDEPQRGRDRHRRRIAASPRSTRSAGDLATPRGPGDRRRARRRSTTFAGLEARSVRWRVESAAAVPTCHRHGTTDPAMVMFTSGTTGPSKGCVLSHRYAVRQAELMIEHLGLRADDVLYCPFPLFHLDASRLDGDAGARAGRHGGDRRAVLGVRLLGRRACVRRDGLRLHGRDADDAAQGAGAPDDIDNPARLAWGVPVPEFAAEFEARFGSQLVELYGSTDAGVPIYHPVDQPRRAGRAGGRSRRTTSSCSTTTTSPSGRARWARS